jgi:hypothetical protein
MSAKDTIKFNEATGEIFVPGRMVWPTLFEARGIKNKPDSKPKFSVSVLIPKAVKLDWERFKDGGECRDPLTKNIAEAAAGKFSSKWRDRKLLMPLFKSVDEPKFRELAEEYPYFLRGSATPEYPPFLFGPDAKPFDRSKQSDVYSGRWAIVAGSAYAYDNVQKGVNFGMNRVQFLDHDEPIAGGRVQTAEGFEAVTFAPGASADAVWDPAA